MIHKHGTCWANKDEIYINIPKNGSTSLKEQIKKRGAVEKNYFKLTKRYTWTVLREPFSRYLSALAQMEKLGLNVDFDNEHLRPQTWFLEGIDIDHYYILEDMDGGILNKSRNKKPITGKDITEICKIYKEDFKLYYSCV